MPTCPDCGSIVMEGDPYCTHCGAHLIWIDDDEENDYYQTSDIRQSIDDKIDSYFRSNYFDPLIRPLLMEKVKEYAGAKDCVDFEVDESNIHYIIFRFTRQNEYVKTVIDFHYDFDYRIHKRIFRDCYVKHYHDALLANPRFKELIKKTGKEFIRCSGGYELDVILAPYDIKLLDEIDISVHFKVGSDQWIYDLDLDRMELSKDHIELDYEV